MKFAELCQLQRECQVQQLQPPHQHQQVSLESHYSNNRLFCKTMWYGSLLMEPNYLWDMFDCNANCGSIYLLKSVLAMKW